MLLFVTLICFYLINSYTLDYNIGLLVKATSLYEKGIISIIEYKEVESFVKLNEIKNQNQNIIIIFVFLSIIKISIK